MADVSDFRLIVIGKDSKYYYEILKLTLLEKYSDDASSPSKFLIDSAANHQDLLNILQEAVQKSSPYTLAIFDEEFSVNSPEALKKIWQFEQTLQAIICVDDTELIWKKLITKIGMNDNVLLLKKPIHPEELCQAIYSLCKKWKLLKDEKSHVEFLKKSMYDQAASLQHSLSLVRATLESSKDGILVIDKFNKVVDYNDKYLEMWQISQSALYTREVSMLIESVLDQLENPTEFIHRVERINKDPDLISCDEFKFRDGRIYQTYSLPHKFNGETIGRVWTTRDITPQVTLEKKLAYRATHDLLTELPNYFALKNQLKQNLQKAAEENLKISLIYFSLDRFNLINEYLGREIGNEILQQVSNRVSESLKDIEILARIESDEFAILSRPVLMDEHLLNIAKQLIKIFAKPFTISNSQILLSPNVGVSFYPRDANTPEQLFNHAWQAMFSSREYGGNEYRLFDNAYNEERKEVSEKLLELLQAIANNQFFLHYQPQYDIENKTIFSVEAVIRWQHPQKGIVYPMDFIPLADDIELMVTIGAWVLRNACQQNKNWQRQGLPPIGISVNITASQLKKNNFFNVVRKILEETQLDPQYLELEISEAVLGATKNAHEMLTKLKKIGVKIVLDDFGKNIFNLKNLRDKIPFDRVKIDHDLFRRINDVNADNQLLISSIIGIANQIGLDILAEGVETQQHLNFLKQHNCPKAQGFYFSKPISAEDLEKILAKQNSI